MDPSWIKEGAVVINVELRQQIFINFQSFERLETRGHEQEHR